MAKLYVQSPNGTANNLSIKTDAFMVGGQSETSYTVHYIVTHSGFLIYKKSYLKLDVTMTLPFPVWEAGVVATVWRPASSVISNLDIYNFYADLTSLNGSSTPYGSFTIKSPNLSNVSLSFLVLAIGEIATSW